MTVIPAALAKALSDKLYDKQRAATQKIERLVLDALDADDEHLIYQLIAELSTDYATSEKEASRIGGLVALAATAVALTHINIRPFLPHMVPPMVSALSDGESKVRYFACESLYNVAKVSRGHILRWFNDIFDGLARVTADSVKTVKDGADYLDRLVKDIVAEQAATCLDWYEGSPPPPPPAVDSSGQQRVEEDDLESTESVARLKPPPGGGPRLAFSLDRFVPLLAERMHTYKPSTRLYLIEWIRVLDSVPGLDLITHLPEFLDGLIRFLSDPSDDVRNKTQSLLGELLSEIRECVEMQGLDDEEEEEERNEEDEGEEEDEGDEGGERGKMREDAGGDEESRRMREDEDGDEERGRLRARRPSRAPSAAGSIPPRPGSRGVAGALSATSAVTPQHHHYVRRSGAASRSSVSLMTSALATGGGGADEQRRMAARRSRIRADRQRQRQRQKQAGGGLLLVRAAAAIDFARCVDILAPHLESSDHEAQALALGWLCQFTWLCPQVLVRCVPRLVNAVLPSVSHPMPALRRTAEDVSLQLYDLVAAAAAPERRYVVVDPASNPATATQLPHPHPPLRKSAAASVVEPAGAARHTARPLPPVTSTAPAEPPTTTTTTTSSQPQPLQPQPLQPQPPRAVSPSGLSAHSIASLPPFPAAPAAPAAPSAAAAPTARRSRTSSVLQTTSALAASPAMAPSPSIGASVGASIGGGGGGDADDDVSDIGDAYATTTTVVIDEPFNYEQAATAIMELFAKNVHEPTKVCGMRWLLLLHRKAPWRILTPEDMSFPVLLKMLSDSSEQVVKLDLELFAQISLYSQRISQEEGGEGDEEHSYLLRFLGSLLQMFATDRVLLETRAALMVRQLCHVLDPQLVFCLFARLLTMPRFSPGEHSEYASDNDEDDDNDEEEEEEGEEEEEEDEDMEDDGLADLEFISVMVQHLSWILVTAPETEGLRLLLREYNADLVQQMPLLPSVRDAVAKDYSQPQPQPQSQMLLRPSRSRGASLSPPVDTVADLNPTDSPMPQPQPPHPPHYQQKPSKLVRAPTTASSKPTTTTTAAAAVSSGRAPAAGSSSGGGGGGAPVPRSRSSTVDLDKSRSIRSKLPGGPSPMSQQLKQRRQQHAEMAALGVRGRNILLSSLQRVEHSIERSRVSHSLFSSLFRAWSHNPAACLTLCLLSQHYAIGSELISVFGLLTPQDLTVSFLVQLDKLVQLIESPVFTYLRLQLLDPMQHPALLRALYGLLMMLPQSSAFAILRNRLSTVAMLPIMSQQSQQQPRATTANNGGGGSGGGESMQQQQQQVHYHYHHHSNTASQQQPPLSLLADSGDVNCAAGLLSSATGVAPAELSELLSLLTTLAKHPSSSSSSSSSLLPSSTSSIQSPPPPPTTTTTPTTPLLPVDAANSSLRRQIPSASALLQQVAEFQQQQQQQQVQVQPESTATVPAADHDDGDTVSGGGGRHRTNAAVVSAADTMRLVDEYRSVRRRYARALARHQSR